MRGAQDGPPVDRRRQQHGARDAGARPPHRLDDLLDGTIQQAVVVRPQPDADLLVDEHRHGPTPPPDWRRAETRAALARRLQPWPRREQPQDTGRPRAEAYSLYVEARGRPRTTIGRDGREAAGRARHDRDGRCDAYR